MASLLYIHGFLSSPRSLKAVQMGAWLTANRPKLRYLCPLLPPYPDETLTTLEKLVVQYQHEPLYLVGSSLGGFWATWLVEKYDLKAVLVNPLVNLGMFNQTYVNIGLKNYHTEDTYMLRDEHIAGFRAVDVPVVQRPANYLLLVQTGDEVLDYRLAVQKYAGSRQVVIPGGEHAFSHFETYILDAMAFLESTG